jgi:hypothetical protein
MILSSSFNEFLPSKTTLNMANRLYHSELFFMKSRPLLNMNHALDFYILEGSHED